jgi:hypothetical protein
MAPTSFGFAERGQFAEYLTRRMEQHQRWQHETEKRLIEEVIDEVQSLPKRQPRSGMLLEFGDHRVAVAQ